MRLRTAPSVMLISLGTLLNVMPGFVLGDSPLIYITRIPVVMLMM